MGYVDERENNFNFVAKDIATVGDVFLSNGVAIEICEFDINTDFCHYSCYFFSDCKSSFLNNLRPNCIISRRADGKDVYFRKAGVLWDI